MGTIQATRTRTGRGKARPASKNPRAPATRQIAGPERLYRELRRRILDNELPGGATYTQAQLARALGPGARSIRDALARLAQEHLVEVLPNQGVRIPSLSIEDMREIFDIMIALEPMAARQVALQGLTSADLERLTGPIQQMDAALLKDDLVAWAKADQLFHTRLIALCGNKRLSAVLTTFLDQRHRARMQTLGMRPIPVDSNRNHAAVVDAMRRHDADAAYTLHHDHLAKSSAMLISLLTRPEHARS